MGKRTIAILPAFNEETRLPGLLQIFQQSATKLVDTVLVVDDGSTDRTASLAEEYEVVLIRHDKRKGLGAALKTGTRFAIDSNYDIIVVMAANGKDNPLEIPKLLNPILEGKAQYIQGSRYLNGDRTLGGDHMPLIRRLATRLHPLLIRWITGFRATDSTNGFRAYNVAIFQDKRINLWQDWLDTVSFEFYLYLMVLKYGYQMLEVPVTKIYKKTEFKFNYSKSGSMTKMRPFIDWWYILKPLIYLFYL